jgi:hypothetical protein
MTTVDKSFADKMVACGGVMYPDDPFEPHVNRIVEYTNAWGQKAYGMTFNGQDPDKYMRPSEYVQEPRVYWERTNVNSIHQRQTKS